MRAITIQALRNLWPDADDPVGLSLVLGTDADGLPEIDADRTIRLLLRALREIELDRRALETRVATLEAKVP